VSVLTGVGIFLVVNGVGEFFVFRHLAKREESIRRRLTLLNANSVFNIIVGIVLIWLGVR
jgi:hypothetical protein